VNDYDQGTGTPKPNEMDEVKPEEAELSAWKEQPEAANLVAFFAGLGDKGKEFLGKKLAEQVCGDVKRAWDSSSEYRRKRRENYKMLTGFLRQKSWPFQHCANAHTPLMLERLLRLSANVYAEIFNDRELIFSVDPTGPDDQETAEILTLHGNWQLRNQLTDFLNQMDRAMMEFFTAGSVFCHSWRDTQANRNRHDIMTCDEFVFPYVDKTDQVDMSDVPWKARFIRRYRSELQDLRDSGEWEQVDEVLKENPPPWENEDGDEVRETGARQEGIRRPENDPNAPYVFIHYVGKVRMPGENFQRPVSCIVEKTRKIVVHLMINEEEDWEDRVRFDRETAELEAFQADTEAYQQTQEQQQALEGQLQQPGIDPEEAAMVQEALPPIPPPVPPEWAEVDEMGMPLPPKPVRKRPIEMFTHGRCLINPAGALGLSFGNILADLNRLADEAYNREFDAATLANIQTWLIRQGVKLGNAANLGITPGKFIPVESASGGKIQDDIMELRASASTGQMMNVVTTAKQDADSSIAAPGVLSGEPGKSGETFRGISTRREQATKQLSAAGIKFIAFLNQIVRNNARLNALFMPDEEIVQVGNHFADARKHTLEPPTPAPPDPVTGQVPTDPRTGQPMMLPGRPKPQITVSAEMYRRSYSTTFTADVRFASEAQRIAEADEAVGILTQVPPLQGIPALVYAVVAKAFKARGMTDLVAALGPPPPMPDLPMGTPPPMPSDPNAGGAPPPPPPGGP
jgi:hypothetical protein